MKIVDFLKKDKILILIILISCLFIFYGLTTHDSMSDESHYSFRAIGYFDYMSSQLQTTPYQWFEKVPGWVKLGFHDHPYLGFLIQHIFFKILGVSLLVARLPFALAGV